VLSKSIGPGRSVSIARGLRYGKSLRESDVIHYSNCWEDAEVLLAALDPRPEGSYLSIASAGDNTLSLLTRNPASVLAVDFSAPQISCLEIRMAAFRALSYRELLAFLGVLPSDSRGPLYARLRPFLSPPTRSYWDRHGRLLEGGLIHCGRLERYFRIFRSVVLPLLLSKGAIDELLDRKSAEERADFYDREVRQGRLAALVNLFFNGKVMGLLGRNRHLFRYAEEGIAKSLPARIRRGLVDAPVHGNPYLEYLLCGNYRRSLPHYLQESSYDAIRKNIGRISLFHGDLRDALCDHGPRTFDGFNLSDIFEALSVEEYRSLRERVIERANPGARLAYWNMQVPREPEEHGRTRASLCRELIRSLHASDRVFFYRSLLIEEVA